MRSPAERLGRSPDHHTRPELTRTDSTDDGQGAPDPSTDRRGACRRHRLDRARPRLHGRPGGPAIGHLRRGDLPQGRRRWWRTGEQDSITRMGSPLTFWKIQQAPTLWTLDRAGLGGLDGRPDRPSGTFAPAHTDRRALDLGRGSLWSRPTGPRQLHGPPGMAMASPYSPSARTCSPTGH